MSLLSTNDGRLDFFKHQKKGVTRKILKSRRPRKIERDDDIGLRFTVSALETGSYVEPGTGNVCWPGEVLKSKVKLYLSGRTKTPVELTTTLLFSARCLTLTKSTTPWRVGFPVTIADTQLHASLSRYNMLILSLFTLKNTVLLFEDYSLERTLIFICGKDVGF